MMKLEAALPVMESLVEHLRPTCLRIEPAGSVLRRKPEVKDLEIVCIPDLTPPPAPKLEFGKPIPKTPKTRLEGLLLEMQDDGAIGLKMNGDRFKKFYLTYAGIWVDLFINIPPSQWGVQVVIRTGPKDFSHWCVANRKFGGALPDGYFVKHQVVWVAEEVGFKYEVPDDPKKAAQMLTPTNHLEMPEAEAFLRFVDAESDPWERRADWGKYTR